MFLAAISYFLRISSASKDLYLPVVDSNFYTNFAAFEAIVVKQFSSCSYIKADSLLQGKRREPSVSQRKSCSSYASQGLTIIRGCLGLPAWY